MADDLNGHCKELLFGRLSADGVTLNVFPPLRARYANQTLINARLLSRSQSERPSFLRIRIDGKKNCSSKNSTAIVSIPVNVAGARITRHAGRSRPQSR